MSKLEQSIREYQGYETLKLFCSAETTALQAEEPFIGPDGRIYATNGRIIIRTKEQFEVGTWEANQKCEAYPPPVLSLPWDADGFTPVAFPDIPEPPLVTFQCCFCLGQGSHSVCESCEGDGNIDCCECESSRVCLDCRGYGRIPGGSVSCGKCEASGQIKVDCYVSVGEFYVSYDNLKIAKAFDGHRINEKKVIAMGNDQFEVLMTAARDPRDNRTCYWDGKEWQVPSNTDRGGQASPVCGLGDNDSWVGPDGVESSRPSIPEVFEELRSVAGPLNEDDPEPVVEGVVVDLCEALTMCLNHIEPTSYVRENVIEIANAALAKARGGAS